MNKISIFLDSDGLIANFSKQFAAKAGLKYPIKQYLNFGWFKPQTQGRDIWEIGVDMEHDFWVTIETYPWSNKIIELVEKYDKNFKILTACTKNAGAFSGKYEWVKNNFGHKYADKLIMCISDKSFAAKNEFSLLIDDRDKNVDRWAKAGGTAYHWKERTEDMIDETMQELEKLEKFFKWNNK